MTIPGLASQKSDTDVSCAAATTKQDGTGLDLCDSGRPSTHATNKTDAEC
jgi:hypothetical protein